MSAEQRFHDPTPSKQDAQLEIENIKSFTRPLSKIITAMGNFSIQYNFQAISIALLVMSHRECTLDDDDCKDGDQAAWVMSSASAMVFVGAITGQLTMGYAGDVIGRNAAMILTLSLVAFGAFMSAAASHGSPTAVYATIIVARFILGIGAGGVYPLSATKAAEDSGSKSGVDIHAAAFAFFWQQPGAMSPWMVALLLTCIPNTSNEVMWRLLLGLGAIPAVAVVAMTAWEMRLNTRVKELQGVDQEVASINNSTAVVAEKDEMLIREMLGQWSTWKDLIATGGGWFIYDVAYYGVNLFGGQILSKIDPTDDDNISSHSSIAHLSGQQLIGLSMGIPACLLSIYCLSFMSTRNLQVLGFVLIAFFFSLLAALFVPLRDTSSDALFAIYCGLLFSLSFGPNLTTYILPAQTYPKRVRATLNGISAAAGKLGAFSGVYLFSSVASVSTYPTVMVICAVLSLFGAWVSWKYITNPAALEIANGANEKDTASMLYHDESSHAHHERMEDGASEHGTHSPFLRGNRM